MKRALGILALIALVSPVAAAFAGPTAISSCGKTITKSGSYVLNKNLAVNKGGGNCITISASNVTLDLGGYNINCNNIGTADGILSVAGATAADGITIRNGFVANCFDGINTEASAGVLIDEMIALNNTPGSGIALAGC